MSRQLLQDLASVARYAEGSRILGERVVTGERLEIVTGGTAEVYYVGIDAQRVVVGDDFTTCECPANREHCKHVERVLRERERVAKAAA